MYVYHKDPMGYTQIDSYRVYGEFFAMGSFGATYVPKHIYYKYRDRLVKIPYNKETLDRYFGGGHDVFPDVTFTTHQISRQISWADTVKVARALGITCPGSPHRPPSKEEQVALRKAIAWHLTA